VNPLTARLIAVLAGPEAERLGAGVSPRRRLALHEAAHAVVGRHLDLSVWRVSIQPELPGAAGYCASTFQSILMAEGRPGGIGDMRIAMLAAVTLGSGPRQWWDARRRVKEARHEVARLVGSLWPVIEAVAGALEEHGALDGEALDKAIRAELARRSAAGSFH
jgi:hypothetical protein